MLPRLDVAGALCVPLLVAFLWRSRSRAAYAGVFVVVARARAVRHVDRRLAVGDVAARSRHRAGQPAERRRERLRVVRRDGAARRAVARREHAHDPRAARSRCRVESWPHGDGARLRPPHRLMAPTNEGATRHAHRLRRRRWAAHSVPRRAYGLDQLIEQRTSSLFPSGHVHDQRSRGCSRDRPAHRVDRRAAASSGLGTGRPRRRRRRRLYDVLDLAQDDVRARRRSRSTWTTAFAECAASACVGSPRRTPARSRAARSRRASSRPGAAPTCARPSFVIDAAARRALDEAELEQVRLVDVLDRVRLLAERRRRASTARPGRPRTCSTIVRSSSRSIRSSPAWSTSSSSSASRAIAVVIEPSCRTCATSRTRRRMRFAMRGVPRERRAISSAASSAISTPRIRAERLTICASWPGS